MNPGGRRVSSLRRCHCRPLRERALQRQISTRLQQGQPDQVTNRQRRARSRELAQLGMVTPSTRPGSATTVASHGRGTVSAAGFPLGKEVRNLYPSVNIWIAPSPLLLKTADQRLSPELSIPSFPWPTRCRRVLGERQAPLYDHGRENRAVFDTEQLC